MKHDPELLELVEAMVRDPRASLFVAHPVGVINRFAEEGEVVRPTRPRLAPAEKELLVVHRDLLAELLLERARTGLSARKLSARLFFDPKHRPLEIDGKSLADTSHLSPEMDTLLAIASGNGDHARATPGELCLMACRLVNSAYGRVLLGIDRSVVGNQAQARTTFLRLLSEPLTERLQRSCMENLGMVYFQMADYGRALECYESVVRKGHESINAAASGLVVATMVRSSKQAWFADLLDDLGPVDQGFVEGLVKDCLADWRAKREGGLGRTREPRSEASAYIIHEVENS